MKRQIDKETKKIHDDQQALDDMVKSAGWLIAEKRLEEFLQGTISVLNIQSKDPEGIAREIAARQMAVQMIQNWLKDLQGDILQYRSQTKPMYRRIEEDIIVMAD